MIYGLVLNEISDLVFVNNSLDCMIRLIHLIHSPSLPNFSPVLVIIFFKLSRKNVFVSHIPQKYFCRKLVQFNT